MAHPDQLRFYEKARQAVMQRGIEALLAEVPEARGALVIMLWNDGLKDIPESSWMTMVNPDDYRSPEVYLQLLQQLNQVTRDILSKLLALGQGMVQMAEALAKDIRHHDPAATRSARKEGPPGGGSPADDQR